MGIASLILGIIAVVTGWIPFICFIALIFAIVGLILGIVDTIKKNKTGDKKRGISIAGLIVSAIAIPVIIFSSIISLGIFTALILDDTYIDSDSDYYDDYDMDDFFTNHNWYNKYYNTLDYNL